MFRRDTPSPSSGLKWRRWKMEDGLGNGPVRVEERREMVRANRKSPSGVTGDLSERERNQPFYALNMETVRFSETVETYESTSRQTPEEHCHPHHRQNLKCGLHLVEKTEPRLLLHRSTTAKESKDRFFCGFFFFCDFM
jgi:hypothetical protein